jgi:hypothetical protein
MYVVQNVKLAFPGFAHSSFSVTRMKLRFRI